MKIDLTNSLQQLRVGQRGIETGFISFPIDGNLVAISGLDVFVQAIITNVGGSALEPLIGKQRNAPRN